MKEAWEFYTNSFARIAVTNFVTTIYAEVLVVNQRRACLVYFRFVSLSDVQQVSSHYSNNVGANSAPRFDVNIGEVLRSAKLSLLLLLAGSLAMFSFYVGQFS